jgi:hypothetical protein
MRLGTNDVVVNVGINVETAESEAQLDEVARQRRIEEQRVRQFVREAFLVFNQTVSLFRTLLRATGRSLDAILGGMITMLQSAISVALATQLLGQAQTLLGNVAAIISIFLASFAIGQSVKAIQQALEAKEEIKMSHGTMMRLFRAQSLQFPFQGRTG